ncbi:ABC transporter substrate-binding protein/permease [Micrococcus terreus]|uniref:ABC transporter substrate-binding protein/permease n=1 Tax=Micrococcus terreus TaxID=574650 RepID=UPI00254FCC92|nr:ABC transporter substrate-binding protein/permease [Micrococcus terreus]MDK7702162.1 ABC transporter substrate-binding protein/permease [Micrococcus terreus]WOO96369.1 ABC transporter substrate-binding protein/permease [Micrococcus terreus]
MAPPVRQTRLRALMLMLTALLALLIGASSATASPQATADASEAEGQTYIIATDTTFAPFEFRDSSGELVGIDMDLMRAIAEKQGFEVEFRSLGFNAALQALTSNQADGVIAGMSITEERQEIYDFSDPYFTGTMTLAVNEGDEGEVADWSDLEGKTLVVKTGSMSEDVARERQEEYGYEITALDQTTTLVESVKSGNADALMDDYPVIAYGVQQGSGLVTVGEQVEAGDYGFAVNKDRNPELLAAFNQGLAELQESGEYQEIMDRYLATEDDGVDRSSFWGLIVTAFPALMTGLGNTLLVTLISFAIAMALGLLFGFMKVSRNAVLRGIATTFVNIFRGTPILVWAFFFYFGLPPLIGVPVNIWVAGVLTLSLNGAAYIAEIVRGAIQSVDPGQMEASRSLGLGYGKSMQRVVLPQAFKIMTPSLINQLVIMLKDSSLLLAIGFAELLYQAQQIYASNFRVTEVLLIVAVIYFIVITALTQLANYVDRKVNV